MDGLREDRMSGVAQKNRRVGMALTLLVAGLFVCSFAIIRHRGQIAEPKNLTPLQRILRGL
jgi:alkylated DNA nucleotide flippase Atl1